MRRHAHRNGERGQATLELALIVPLITVFLLFGADLAIMGTAGRQAQTAAQRCAVEAAAQLDCGETFGDTQARQFAENAYAGLFDGAESSSVTVTVSSPVQTPYDHKVIRDDKSVMEVHATASKKHVTVDVSVERHFITPLGRLFALLPGGEGSDLAEGTYTASGSYTAPYDTTEETWS